MNFSAVFWVEILASLISVIVAITLSSQGYGYFSLVWSSLANTFVCSIAISIFKRGGMFHRITLCESKAVFSYGAQLTLTNLTGQISTNANDLITGKLLGFTETAIISRAQGLMYLFHRDITATIRGVAFPAFANAHREGRDIDQDYIKAVTILTVFAWPFYGFFSLFPVEALRLLFGPQWDQAGALVPWFCAGGAAAATCSLIPTLLPALGGVRYLVRLHFIVDPLRVITFVIVTYIYRTPQAFAIAFLIFFTLPVPLLYYFKDRIIKTRYKLLMQNLIKSLIASIFALVIPACIASLHYYELNELIAQPTIGQEWLYKTPEQHYFKEWLIIPIGILMLPTWILGLVLVKHPLTEEALFKRIIYFRPGAGYAKQ